MAETPDPWLLVLGEGMLAAAIRALPSAHGREARHSGAPTLVAPVSDRWVADHDKTRERCRQRGLAMLPVRTELGRVVLGPLERPGKPGCSRCADARRDRAREDDDSSGLRAIRERHGAELSATSSALLTTLSGTMVASLLAEETELLAAGRDTRTREALLLLDLRTLEVTRHPFLPDPRCVVCSRPRRTVRPESVPVSRPKPAPDNYRVGGQPDLDTLTDVYVDAEAGLVRRVEQDTSSGYVLTQAPFGLRDNHRRRRVELGYGRTHTYPEGRGTAICEALERYAGLQQGEEPQLVRAAYVDIADRALNLGLVGWHPEESYAEPEFPYPRFDPERQRDWVQGYSLTGERPVLVPERLAYYGPHPRGLRREGILFETSNGSAVGSCLEEAALHGILEFAERDAFLITWHAGLRMPRVDPDSAADRTIPMLVHELSRRTGYRLTILDITMEQGIPCALAVAVRDGDDPDRPKAACAVGSHLIAERAVLNALAELGPTLDMLPSAYADNRDTVEAMVEDPSYVREMPDHSLLYADERSFDRFAFLTEPTATLPISEAFGASHPVIAHDDLRDDLSALLERFTDTGLEVVLVDQTTFELTRAGLRCVKMFIPGMLTMTFGHRNRRLSGVPRLREVPALLGHTDRPLLDSELNLHPHPFP
ncbi:ribosomal protein S12 methylthiotransferase accessory factor [Lipingzhangella halophila]|uniref:Ribosomal protein S12 methylthiotransferase accessory factor n=1 Tax=Lipingzhangella halophila TaxID=1783352 RepID=A0A7W7W3V6_9ACTN|nr:TOMM precursor leader peptide-binding protein [Lipingzhangella halophila]MBB4933462.1 ribosomal protein S12 methylthiotransferase accessory factor [Lipingzhangella halophila]